MSESQPRIRLSVHPMASSDWWRWMPSLGTAMAMFALLGGCQQERAASVKIPTLDSTASYEEQVLKSKQLVMVDFGASWCGPCHMMEPIVADLAAEYDGRAVVRYVDVDQATELAEMFQIQSLPTFVFIRDGKEVGREIGTMSYRQLRSALDQHLRSPDVSHREDASHADVHVQ